MKIKASRMVSKDIWGNIESEITEYDLDTDSITEIFDEVRSLWKMGYYIIEVRMNEDERLVFDIAPGGRNVFGKINK